MSAKNPKKTQRDTVVLETNGLNFSEEEDSLHVVRIREVAYGKSGWRNFPNGHPFGMHDLLCWLGIFDQVEAGETFRLTIKSAPVRRRLKNQRTRRN